MSDKPRTLKQAIQFGMSLGPINKLDVQVEEQVRDFLTIKVEEWMSYQNEIAARVLLTKFLKDILKD